MTDLYPTEWRFATEAGCHKRCKFRARRMELRHLAEDKHQLRHVWPITGPGGLAEVFAKADLTYRTGIVGGGSTCYAVTPRLGGLRGDDVPVEGQAFGSNQRQALQNLADQLGLRYGARCTR
jgi:hypothetical protein